MKITKGCINCSACVALCPVEAITESNGIISIDNDLCLNCGMCISHCPVGVILEDEKCSITSQVTNSPSLYSIENLKGHGHTYAKDILARTIIWGGYAAAKFVLCILAVSAGLIDRSTAKGLSKMISKLGPEHKKKLWRVYEQTGSILEIFNHL